MVVSVFAPASSANLGPGFDCLAVALDRWLRVDLSPAVDDLRDAGSVDLLGGGNLVIEAMRATAERFSVKLPGCAVRVASDIPVARGLGSSAAAIVAGIRAAAVLASIELSDAEVITVGGEMEGHADNIAAATLGGVVAAIRAEHGHIGEQLALRLPWATVIFIPKSPAFTQAARQVLPAATPVPDTVWNVGRAVMLYHAIQHGRADLLREATRDRLHQPYRTAIFPHLDPCIGAALEAGAAGACLSGAGPSVLAFADEEHVAEVRRAMEQVSRAHGVDGEGIVLGVPERGCYVVRGTEGSGFRVPSSE